MAKRFPAQIGSFRVSDGLGLDYSPSGLLDVVRAAVRSALSQCARPGVLLSGGVDSTLLALLVKQELGEVLCFTIGADYQHPDVIAAMRVASELGFDLRVYLPGVVAKESAAGRVESSYPGDHGVLLALEFAAKFVDTLIATDGVDELMGGYWWHANPGERSLGEVFQHFWDGLEEQHLTPMYRSACKVGVDVFWVYLSPEIVEYVERVPLVARVCDGVQKAFWKDVARLAGVPEWVVVRPKRGFVHAL